MNNRLLELKEMGSSKSSSYKQMNEDFSSSILPEFQMEIAKVKRIIKEIESCNEDIEDLRQKYSKATTAVSEKDINSKINQIIKEATMKNTQLKQVLTIIEDQVKDSVATKPDDPETNIKQTNLNAIRCKVKEVLQDFQTTQITYKQTVKDKIKREAQYMDSSLSEREVEEICNDPTQVSQMMQKRFNQSATVQQLNTFNDIQEKHKEILELERSVRQVDELFKDLAMLVHHQGLMIDDIESNVKTTKTNTTLSNKHLGSAKTYHQKSKKKMCCLILIGVIILVAIIVPVALK
ncbi:hypothetical protein ABPG72_014764 [Tetrahymena utriculariae]